MTNESPIIRVNSAMLLVGGSGSGKSSLIATYADWVWNNFRKITLLYSCDGGGYPDAVLVRVRKGIIWVWRMPTRAHPFETFDRATKGWWPEKINNPETGETDPSCRLVEPFTTIYTLRCPNGHVVKTSTDRKQAILRKECQQCKEEGKQVLVDQKNGQLALATNRTPGFEQIGGVAFDGLTSMQGDIMMDLSNRSATGNLGGAESALGGKIIDNEFRCGGNNQSHYNFAQLRAAEWIIKSTTIPGLVAPPIWTALERQADDTITNLPVYGPQVAGKALTSAVPQWFGDCLGTQIHIDDKGMREYRLHLKEYRLQDNIPHLCKTRALPEYVTDDYLSDDPSTTPFVKFNLGHYFSIVSDALQKAIEKADNDIPDAPGMPAGGIGTVGIAEQVDSLSPSPAPVPANPAPLPTPKSTTAKGGRVLGRPMRGRPSTNSTTK